LPCVASCSFDEFTFDGQLDNYIAEYLEGTANPRAYGKPLKGNLIGFWRYQVGDYRLIADIQDNIFTILVMKVGHRREIYRCCWGYFFGRDLLPSSIMVLG
jgi:mRNA-degrading endonuclease RelE of RelBE toxin-antitoxin system